METITKKYDTDKYKDLIPAYEELFADIRNEKLKILEVGVWRGGSMLWLKDFFPNAEIYGIDINLPKMNEERITLIQADQNDTEKLKEIAKIGFDIVIDDGSHFPKETQNTLNVFWEATKKHYIIEDWDAGINKPSKYKGLENVVFGVIRKRHELGIKRLQVEAGRKSYAYFLKGNEIKKGESVEKHLKDLTCDIKNMDSINFKENKKILNEFEQLKKSKSFRLGNLFFRSIRNPWKIFTFPLNLVLILIDKNGKK
ncbi:MAG: hypothetical protein WCZ08_03375 [Parcubacteria group bacterium]